MVAEAVAGGISGLAGPIFGWIGQKDAIKAENKANELAAKSAKEQAKSAQFAALFGSNQNRVVYIVLGLFVVVGLLFYFINKK